MFGLKDPASLLRPWRNLQQFSEELFAMMTKGGETPGALVADPKKPDTLTEVFQGRKGDAGVTTTDFVRRTRLEAARTQPTASPERARDSQASTRREPPAAKEEPSFRLGTIGSVSPEPRDSRREPSPRPGQADVVSREVGKPARFAPDQSLTRRSIAHNEQSGVQADPGRRSHQGSGAAQAPGVKPQPLPVASPPPAKPKPAEFRLKPQVSLAKPTPFLEPERKTSPPPKRDPVLDIGDFMKLPGGGGGTASANTFMGKIVSGSGNTYEVTLYRDGPNEDPDDETVTVHIPMIADDDAIPADSWIAPVFEFIQEVDSTAINAEAPEPTYFCQPPVWMP